MGAAMFSKRLFFVLAACSFLNHAVAEESIKVGEILAGLESTKIDRVVVQVSLVRKVNGELPAEVVLMASEPQISHVPSPESIGELIYDRQRGTRFTNHTHGAAWNVRNNVEVLLEPNHYPSDGEAPWNVAYCAYQRPVGELPIVHSEPPVQMMMLWLDPLGTALFKDLYNQFERSVPITEDSIYGQVASIEIPERKSRVLLSKSARWRPVVVEKFRDEERYSLTTYKYSVNADGVLVTDSIEMNRKTPSGREIDYQLAVKGVVVREIADSDIAIQYPAYTLLEVEDEAVGMREFVTSSSGRLRELAPRQHQELDRMRLWRKFADGQ